MKLVEWETIKQKISRVLKTPDKKEDYLSKLIDNFEKKIGEKQRHPFKITRLGKHGFTVKIYGLYAYISFYHMPWKYANKSAWKTVFPYLEGKFLFGKIFKFHKEPLSIVLDGAIPQFKTPKLYRNKQYKGVILNKIDYGVFVDIGYNFKWECGALVGLLHRSKFENESLFEVTNPGETIEVFFCGYNEKEQLIFGQQPETKEWFTGEIEDLVGETLPVHVSITGNGKKRFLVENKYTASLLTSKSEYPNNRKRRQIKQAVKKLENDDLIHCIVTKLNRAKKTFELMWESPAEIEEIHARDTMIRSTKNKQEYKRIKNRINAGLSEKLKLIGTTVNVEVIKKEDHLGRIRTKYLVENKYFSQLQLSNDCYKISNKEKEQIEKNLQEGEILTCEVLSVENNILKVKWNLKEEELTRFLRA